MADPPLFNTFLLVCESTKKHATQNKKQTTQNRKTKQQKQQTSRQTNKIKQHTHTTKNETNKNTHRYTKHEWSISWTHVCGGPAPAQCCPLIYEYFVVLVLFNGRHGRTATPRAGWPASGKVSVQQLKTLPAASLNCWQTKLRRWSKPRCTVFVRRKKKRRRDLITINIFRVSIS